MRLTWSMSDCSDLLPIPFPFCTQSLHFLGYFYTEQTVLFSPVCKCTIKELVVRNHRIWTRAKSGQLFMRRPQILNWSPPALPPPPRPPPWGMTQAGRGNKSSACQTTACLDSSLQKLHPPRGEAMLRWLATSLQTEMYLKRRSPKIVKSWTLQGCFYW